jgi:Tfp pilus assembly protein FimT
MIVVVAILGVVLGVSVPAIRDARSTNPLDETTREASALLDRARRSAVERAAPVTIVIDPITRRYWVRLSAGAAAADTTIVDSLGVIAGVTIDTLPERVVIAFARTGEARGDTLVLRWHDHTATVSADAWTGDAHVATR